jgi:hypothetical protein
MDDTYSRVMYEIMVALQMSSYPVFTARPADGCYRDPTNAHIYADKFIKLVKP